MAIFNSYVSLPEGSIFDIFEYVWTILNLDVSRAMDQSWSIRPALDRIFFDDIHLEQEAKGMQLWPIVSNTNGCGFKSSWHKYLVASCHISFRTLDDWMDVASVPTLQIGPSDWDGESWDEYFSEGVWKPPVGVKIVGPLLSSGSGQLLQWLYP